MYLFQRGSFSSDSYKWSPSVWTSESLYMPMIFLSFINFWSSEVYVGRMWYSLERPWEMSKMHKICINALYDSWGCNCNEDGEGKLKWAQTVPPVSVSTANHRRQAEPDCSCMCLTRVVHSPEPLLSFRAQHLALSALGFFESLCQGRMLIFSFPTTFPRQLKAKHVSNFVADICIFIGSNSHYEILISICIGQFASFHLMLGRENVLSSEMDGYWFSY